jgi:protein O-mannosyl-transferase
LKIKDKINFLSDVELHSEAFWWHLGFVFLAIAACFAPSLGNDFVWDARIYVMEPEFYSPLNLKNLNTIFSKYYLGNYHPITMLSYALEANIAGQKLAIFYNVNQILLHAACCYLVYKTLVRLALPGAKAWFCVFLFAIHPLHVESVSWVAQRKDLLYVLFSLLAVNTYLDYCAQKVGRFYIQLLLYFVLACLSKAMAVVLPLLLLLLDLFVLKQKISIKLVYNKLPMLVLSVFFGWIAILAQKEIGAINTQAVQSFGVADRLVLVLSGIGFYWQKMLLPTNLSALYPYGKVLGGLWPQTLVALVVLFAAILAFKKHKIITFGILFFLVAIAPVLQLLPVGQARVADRYFYFSSIGTLLVLVYVFEYLRGRFPKLGLYVWGFVLLFFMNFTVRRTAVWKDDYSLFKNVLKQYPQNGYITANIGWYFSNQTSYKDSTLYYFEKAKQLGWSTAEMEAKLGEIDFGKENYQAAMAHFEQAKKMEPNRKFLDWMLGTTYYYLKQPQKAAYFSNLAITADSSNVAALNLRALVKIENGQWDQAEADLKTAIKLDKNFEDAHLNLAFVNHNKGLYNVEINSLLALIQLKPKHKNQQAYKNLGAAYVTFGNPHLAIDIWQKAILADSTADASLPYNIGLQYVLKDSLQQGRYWLQQAKQKGSKQAAKLLLEID